MKPTFALYLNHDGIELFHRARAGWRRVGLVPLDDPDLSGALEVLRRTGAGLEPGGLTTKVVIPDSQILYTEVEVSGSGEGLEDRIRAALEGRTPYAVDDLVFDWRLVGGGRAVLAVIARETLAEAETFAHEHRFNPVSFVGAPQEGQFPGEPWFGAAASAAGLLAEAGEVEPDAEPVPVRGARVAGEAADEPAGEGPLAAGGLVPKDDFRYNTEACDGKLERQGDVGGTAELGGGAGDSAGEAGAEPLPASSPQEAASGEAVTGDAVGAEIQAPTGEDEAAPEIALEEISPDDGIADDGTIREDAAASGEPPDPEEQPVEALAPEAGERAALKAFGFTAEAGEAASGPLGPEAGEAPSEIAAAEDGTPEPPDAVPPESRAGGAGQPELAAAMPGAEEDEAAMLAAGRAPQDQAADTGAPEAAGEAAADEPEASAAPAGEAPPESLAGAADAASGPPGPEAPSADARAPLAGLSAPGIPAAPAPADSAASPPDPAGPAAPPVVSFASRRASRPPPPEEPLPLFAFTEAAMGDPEVRAESLNDSPFADIEAEELAAAGVRQAGAETGAGAGPGSAAETPAAGQDRPAGGAGAADGTGPEGAGPEGAEAPPVLAEPSGTAPAAAAPAAAPAEAAAARPEPAAPPPGPEAIRDAAEPQIADRTAADPSGGVFPASGRLPGTAFPAGEAEAGAATAEAGAEAGAAEAGAAEAGAAEAEATAEAGAAETEAAGAASEAEDSPAPEREGEADEAPFAVVGDEGRDEAAASAADELESDARLPAAAAAGPLPWRRPQLSPVPGSLPPGARPPVPPRRPAPALKLAGTDSPAVPRRMPPMPPRLKGVVPPPAARRAPVIDLDPRRAERARARALPDDQPPKSPAARDEALAGFAGPARKPATARRSPAFALLLTLGLLVVLAGIALWSVLWPGGPAPELAAGDLRLAALPAPEDEAAADLAAPPLPEPELPAPGADQDEAAPGEAAAGADHDGIPFVEAEAEEPALPEDPAAAGPLAGAQPAAELPQDAPSAVAADAAPEGTALAAGPDTPALPADPLTELVPTDGGAAERVAEQLAAQLTPELAERMYDESGVWVLPPGLPAEPRGETTDGLYTAAIDTEVAPEDAVGLEVQPAPDKALLPQLPPPPAGTTFDFDENGLVRATPEGALTPDGLIVTAGRPPAVPPARPGAAAAPAPAAAGPGAVAAPAAEDGLPMADPAPPRMRPHWRPDDLTELNEKATLGGRTRVELAALKPLARPAEIVAAAAAARNPAPSEAELAAAAALTSDSKLAIPVSLVPKSRPGGFDKVVAAAVRPAPGPAPDAGAGKAQGGGQSAEEDDGEVEVAAAMPKLPTKANVAKTATIANALKFEKVNLIGVFGTPSSRKALVRLSNGKYLRVGVGDRLDGGRVAAIGETQLVYVKGSRQIRLDMPSKI